MKVILKPTKQLPLYWTVDAFLYPSLYHDLYIYILQILKHKL